MADRAITVAAWESLFRAQVTIMRALAAEFPSEIMSLNEYDVLFNITRAPGRRLRLKELNRSVLITQPSVSRLVDRLAIPRPRAKTHDPKTAAARSSRSRRRASRSSACGVHPHRRDRPHVGHALDERELRDLTELCDRLRLGVAEPAGDAVDADDALPADS